MATKTTEETSKIEISETGKKLEDLGNKITNILRSEEYAAVVKAADELAGLLKKDDEAIKTSNKSEYTITQRNLMSSQLLATNAIDSSFGNLMNILELHYREEVRVAAFKQAEVETAKLDKVAAENAEKKEEK